MIVFFCVVKCNKKSIKIVFNEIFLVHNAVFCRKSFELMENYCQKPIIQNWLIHYFSDVLRLKNLFNLKTNWVGM